VQQLRTLARALAIIHGRDGVTDHEIGCLSVLIFIIVVALKLAYQFHDNLDGGLSAFSNLLQIGPISFF
jgi:hypothetical protein